MMMMMVCGQQIREMIDSRAKKGRRATHVGKETRQREQAGMTDTCMTKYSPETRCSRAPRAPPHRPGQRPSKSPLLGWLFPAAFAVLRRRRLGGKGRERSRCSSAFERRLGRAAFPSFLAAVGKTGRQGQARCPSICLSSVPFNDKRPAHTSLTTRRADHTLTRAQTRSVCQL